jgi:3-(3-hydroxy-phenyl)propionate hydroxylase
VAEPTDVVIVGLGPVGATLANLLGMIGLTVIVLERDATAYALPRAVHFDDEVMRVFQTIGLSDTILPMTYASPGMRFQNEQGATILEWLRPPGIGPLGWRSSFRFHQPELEGVLRAGLTRFANVTVHTRADVFAIEQDTSGAQVHYKDLTSGRLIEVKAHYVVGCDGGRSLVRRLIGGEQDDLGFHERWLVVDAILQRRVPALGDFSIQYCERRRPSTYVRGVGERRRWEISALPNETPEALTSPETLWRLLSRWITPDDATIERATVYAFHSTIATRWRDRRLLIAGDAAHQTPPFLGQGMCAGIRDVANLAWKLRAVLREGAAERLLDTYQSERVPHVRAYIELAVKLGQIINASASNAGGSEMADKANGPTQLATIKPRLGPGLLANTSEPKGQDPIGTVAPQPRLPSGGLLDDDIGYHFALLTTTSAPDWLDQVAAGAIRTYRVAHEGALADLLTATAAVGLVVRPDRYIMGLVRTPDDITSWLQQLQWPSTSKTARTS